MYLRTDEELEAANAMHMAAGFASGIAGDLYVALGEAIDDRTWTVRVHVKPFVDWIWGGAFLMALGGLLAIGDRRYRLAATQTQRHSAKPREAIA